MYKLDRFIFAQALSSDIRYPVEGGIIRIDVFIRDLNRPHVSTFMIV